MYTVDGGGGCAQHQQEDSVDCRGEGPSSSTLYGGGGCAQHQEDSVDRRGEGPSSSTLQYMVVVDVRNTSRRILLAVEGRAPLVVLYMVS